MEKQTPLYNRWQDRAGNVGIQCAVCSRDHWNQETPTTDPVRGKECDNCLQIKEQGILATEQTIHNTEKRGEPCLHRPTQP